VPPGASHEEIKAAWRDLAKVWHPDRFQHDPRLRQKAGENLSRINEAVESLKDYDPAAQPNLGRRVRESVAIILGMGEIGEPPPSDAPHRDPEGSAAAPAAAFVPTAPIGLRHSLHVLGLGPVRATGQVGTRRHHRRAARRQVLIAAGTVLLLLAIVAVLLWRR
jgi:curved DNA-binding protein CbpA